MEPHLQRDGARGGAQGRVPRGVGGKGAGADVKGRRAARRACEPRGGSGTGGRTTQGVRRCPSRVRTQRPVTQQMSFTVWSPLPRRGPLVGWGGGSGGKAGPRAAGVAGAGAHCVEASRAPSGLNAAAMVDLGSGCSE